MSVSTEMGLYILCFVFTNKANENGKLEYLQLSNAPQMNDVSEGQMLFSVGFVPCL